MNECRPSLRVFSAEDVRAALPMDVAVHAMKRAFRELSDGTVTVPNRTQIELPQYRADVLVMSCYSPRLAQVGLKLITLHPDNLAHGRPLIHATVMVVDAEYGTPLAIMSGEVLTAIRTGAACGAATDALARRDASRVAIFGSGNQAATQLEAMCTVRAIRAAAVFDTDRKRADVFAARMSAELKIAVGVAETPRAALADADIVCTATTSNTAVFDDADLAPGTHINAIGVYKPWKREIPGATVARARVVVDSIPSAWDEAGDLILAREEGLIVGSHVYAELGEILDGRTPGREQEDQITLFKSVGIANQDLAAAHVVLTRGAEMGLGTAVKL